MLAPAPAIAADPGRARWPNPAPARPRAAPPAASLLSHAMLVAGLLAVWGSATVVPAPPPDIAVGMLFEAAPPPPAPLPPPPPPAEAPPPPPVEAPSPPPPPPPPPQVEALPAPKPPPPKPKPVPVKPPPKPTSPRPAAVAPVPPAVAPALAPPVAPRAAPVAPAPAGVTQPAALIGTAPGDWCRQGSARGWDLSRVTGPVVLRIEIGADGVPTSVSITESSGYPKLDRAARDDTTFCHFRPRMQGGIPVPGVAMRRFRPVAQE